MSKRNFGSRMALIVAMAIFGTIGIFRRYIPLPSCTVALCRALVGVVFLAALMGARRQKPDLAAIGRRLPPLLLSGVFLGLNWMLLFEAYRYTSVATATLCYYMAPVLLILASPLLGERLTRKKLICAAVALLGMVLVSGVADGGLSSLQGGKGILLGLAAAVLYTAIVMLNKKTGDVPALDKTLLQFAVSAVVLLPYVLLTEGLPTAAELSVPTLVLLLVVGVLHTGFAYALYFGAVPHLPADAVALFSYIDPVLAVLLSALLLREPMTVAGGIGAVLILGAALVAERK